MDDNANPAAEPKAPAHPPRRFAGLSRRGATGLVAFGLMTGAFAGGYIVTNAATSPSPTPSSSSSGTTATPTPSSSSSSGTFKSNEDPTHEAGESAAREAAENSGRFPGPMQGTSSSGTTPQ